MLVNDDFIALRDLSIGYDGRPVLSGISVTIKRGSFTAILGANGSGKSTLLKTLLGLQPTLAGRMDISAPLSRPAIFGYVPQSVQFDPLYRLTGFEVALMGLYGRIGPGRWGPSHEKSFVRECLRSEEHTSE